ncbi:MAG TPA: hypothetical protein DCY94_00505 [Firmicutes bacterium]|nr:hypothetical protein [Bacillota bacterium]
MEKIGVFKFVTETFSADMTKNVVTKPSEEYFMELIDFIGCSKDEILMIGDSFENDISGALNVGIDSCWFDRKEETRPLNLNPTYVVENLRDLLSML